MFPKRLNLENYAEGRRPSAKFFKFRMVWTFESFGHISSQCRSYQRLTIVCCISVQSYLQLLSITMREPLESWPDQLFWHPDWLLWYCSQHCKYLSKLLHSDGAQTAEETSRRKSHLSNWRTKVTIRAAGKQPRAQHGTTVRFVMTSLTGP